MFDDTLDTTKGRLKGWTDSIFVDHAIFRLVWNNTAEVLPGRLYRSNHPTPGRLARAQRELGLKTLINLRGPRKCGSEALSVEMAKNLGMNHVYMAFESRGAPHRDRILRFADIFTKLETPALMHCKSGADRAGLASGLAIMFEGGTTEQAMRQLSWRFGHFNRSRTGILDAFFLHYRAVAEGRTPFLEWVERDYDEVALKRDFVANGLASFITDKILRRE